MKTATKRKPFSLAYGQYPREKQRLEHRCTAPAATPCEGEPITLASGHELYLRPIYPSDVTALKHALSHLSQDEVRMRFLHIMKEMPDPLAKRLCQLDPERELAFVLIDPPGTVEPALHGVARAYFDPVTDSAEFALVVQKAYTGQGLGTQLMQRLITACRRRGIGELWGDVLVENDAMLKLSDQLGFVRRPVFHDPGIARVVLTL